MTSLTTGRVCRHSKICNLCDCVETQCKSPSLPDKPEERLVRSRVMATVHKTEPSLSRFEGKLL